MGRKAQRVDPATLPEALGAVEVSVPLTPSQTPSHLCPLRQLLSESLASTGGRPGRSEPTERKKIPITKSDWAALTHVAQVMRNTGIKTTPGQVAGALLHQSLHQLEPPQQRVELSPAELKAKADRLFAAAASAGISVQELEPVAVELLRRMSVHGHGLEQDVEES